MGMLKGLFPKKSKVVNHIELLEWFSENQSQIFAPGDIQILIDSIEWKTSDKFISMNWNDVVRIFIANDNGFNSIFIEDVDQNTIKFYVNNKSKKREIFHQKLVQFAKLNNAQLVC